MRRFLPFAIIGTVLLIAVGSGLLLFRSKQSSAPVKVAAGRPGAEPSHIRGDASARVTLEEFGDYQCAPCRVLAETLHKLEQSYGNRIQIVFRQFPLDMHAHAMTAASAAEAAGLQGHFWEMHDLLFEHALAWSQPGPRPFKRPVPNPQPDASANDARVRTVFADYATNIGLDVERFKKEMDSEEVKARIRLDQERGDSIGVDRTPVLFIDAVKIPFSSYNVEALSKLIDDALQGKPLVPETPTPTPATPR